MPRIDHLTSRHVPPAYSGLPGPVRIAAWGLAALAIGIAVGATFPGAMRLVGQAVALAPERLAWYGVRVTGFLAWFALAGSVLYGLLLSTGLLDTITHRAMNLRLHRDLALVALGLSAAHGLLLLADRSFPFTLRSIVVPFASPYAPVAVGAGQLAAYLVAGITASYYVRGRIGLRTWRLIHYLTFAAFVGVAVHGIASGSDTRASWATWCYLAPAAGAVFLATYRLVVALAGRRPASGSTRVLVPGRTPRPS